MKNFKSVLASLVLVLTFASCSTNEEMIEDQSAALNLLESYTLSKNESGIYSLDYKVSDKATSQLIKNTKANTNEIYLYSSDVQSQRTYKEELTINNNELKVGFVDTNSDQQPKITIIDDNIVFGKGSESSSMLSEYGITGNADGTYSLDFSVENKVEVDFVYNEEEDIYEVHLVKGEGKTSDFSKTFSFNSDKLRIDFINHKNTAAKGYAYKEVETEKKPRVTVDKGEGIY